MTRVHAKLLGPCFKTGRATTYDCTANIDATYRGQDIATDNLSHLEELTKTPTTTSKHVRQNGLHRNNGVQLALYSKAITLKINFKSPSFK